MIRSSGTAAAPTRTTGTAATGAAVGRYTAPVSELAHPYVRPQETGTRTDTRWVAVTDGSGTGLLVTGLPTVSFSALPYTIEDLDAGETKSQRHWADLVPRDEVTLSVDYRQQGVGGDDSWGAVPHHEYTLWPREMGFRFLLRPLRPGDDPGPLARERMPDSAAADAVAGRSLALDHFGEANRVEHLARERPVEVVPASSSRYSAAGDAGLVDGIRGSIDRRGGHWQGYLADEVTAVIELDEGAAVEAVKVGFLQHPGSGVYFPRRVEVAVSEDGVVFGEAVEGEVGGGGGSNAESPEGGRLYVSVPLGSRAARAIRVRIRTFRHGAGRLAVRGKSGLDLCGRDHRAVERPGASPPRAKQPWRPIREKTRHGRRGRSDCRGLYRRGTVS